MTLSAGDLYYNGFYFPPAISATVRQRPVEDSTRRFAKYQTFSLLVEVLLYAGCDDKVGGTGFRTDPATGTTYEPKFPKTIAPALPATTDGASSVLGITSVRRLLSEPGGILMYKDKGMGVDFVFRGNATQTIFGQPGNAIDTTYGPKPKLLVWEQIAGNKCTRLIWECEVTFADCDLNWNPRAAALSSEFNYDVNWAISSCGLTTRTINGQVEIPIQRQGSQLLGNADIIREKVKFGLITGFKRDQNWNLSSDRRFLRFTITDTEIDSEEPYKTGACEMDVRHTVQNRGVNIRNRLWTITISGSIRIAAGFDKWLAWLAFAQILEARMAPSRALRFVGPPDEEGKQKEHSGGVISSLRISEEIYGRSMDFSVSYWIVDDLKNIRNSSGLWVPIAHNSWSEYANGMSQQLGPFTPRGNAHLLHRSEDDVIIAMCGEQSLPSGASFGIDRVPRYPGDLDSADGPGKDEGYYPEFDAVANLYEDTGTVSAQCLGGSAVGTQPVDRDTEGTGIPRTSTGESPKVEMMQRHSSNFKVEFYGHAMRFDKPVPRVTLQKYGKQTAHPIDKLHFEQREVVTLDGRVLHLARWYGNYQLLSAPTDQLISEPKTSDFV